MSKAPFVAMRTDIVKDERVAALADFAGYNVYEARGRLFTLWAWCVDRKLLDVPEGCDGHAVSEAIVRRFMGPRGVEGMLAEGCDELALGDRRPDGLIYLRGTDVYVAKIRALIKAASAGAKARGEAPRGDDGRFVGEPTVDQPPSGPNPADDQPAPAVTPAASSPLHLHLQIPTDQTKNTYTRTRADGAGAVARAVWQYGATQYATAKDAGIDSTAPAAAWPAMPDASSRGWTYLLDRCEALLAIASQPEAIATGKRRIDVAIAEAKRSGSLQYCVPVFAFEAKSWEIGCSRSPEQVAARAGPRSPSSPQVGRVEPEPSGSYPSGKQDM